MYYFGQNGRGESKTKKSEYCDIHLDPCPFA
jgi:hypothetical protein